MKQLLIVLLFISTFSYSQIAPDKVDHFVGGAFVSLTTYAVVGEITHNKKKAFWYSLGASILAGTIKELSDKSKGAKFDKADLLASTLGGFTVSMTLQIIPKEKQPIF